MLRIIINQGARQNCLKDILPYKILGNHFLMGVLGNPRQPKSGQLLDGLQFIHGPILCNPG